MSARPATPDAPKAWVLVAIAATCGGAGFVLARSSLDVDRAARASEVRATPDASPTDAAAAVEPADAGIDLGATAEAMEPTEPVPTEPEPTEPEPTEPVPTEPEPTEPVGGPTTLELGRIAYIRCEGVDTAAPGACPRDLTVERRVVEALETLPSCPALAGRTGSADVRVVFAGGRVSGLGFRDLGETGLDREAVRGCLEPRLAQLRTSLPTTRMTVTFAFELRR